MTWQEVIEHKSLENLPFKIELNARGAIEMSPATNRHGIYQMLIGATLLQLLDNGISISECSIETADGVKVADVTWLSRDFLAIHGDTTPFLVAPEICVEIISPSNSKQEILSKIGLYFGAGAKEVWTCNLEGNMVFYDFEGIISQSVIAPNFPKLITW
jgi:Uma2 family endonuclease